MPRLAVLAAILAIDLSIVPCGAAQPGPAAPPTPITVRGWRYTMSSPQHAWTQPDYSDASWAAGEPGFGNRGLPLLQQSLVKTAWTTADIRTRATFEMKDASSPLALRLSHDEDVEIYINGVLVCRREGYIADYVLHRLAGPVAAALRPGRNVLAAHCHQTVGGQFLDVQVVDTSGYCHTKTDVVDLHVNPPNGKACQQWWDSWRRSIAASGNFAAYPDRPAYAKGFRHQGRPVVISETGSTRSDSRAVRGTGEA
jgi:hypothetical protein